MKKIIIMLLVFACSMAYAVDAKKLLLGKWKAEVLTSDGADNNIITSSGTMVFDKMFFSYTYEIKNNVIFTTKGSSYYGDNLIRVFAQPFYADFKLQWVNKNEIYLINTENEDHRIRLTR